MKNTALAPDTGGPHTARLAVAGRFITTSGEPLKRRSVLEVVPAISTAAV
jgi:hypothetical protein